MPNNVSIVVISYRLIYYFIICSCAGEPTGNGRICFNIRYRVGSGRVEVEEVWLQVWCKGFVPVVIHLTYLLAAPQGL